MNACVLVDKGLFSGTVDNPVGATLTVTGTSMDITTTRDRDSSF